MLSRYIAEEINRLDSYSYHEEVAQAAVDRKQLLESVEALYGNTTSTTFTQYHSFRDLTGKYPVLTRVLGPYGNALESLLDDSLARLLVSEIPRMVARILKLEPVLTERRPQADEDAYLREATRCYLYGLFNASVALARSALEQALSRRIPKLLQNEAQEEGLQALIKTARVSILKQESEMCDHADEVRKKANDVVHGKTCQESDALRVLQLTREIIGRLYKDQ